MRRDNGIGAQQATRQSRLGAHKTARHNALGFFTCRLARPAKSHPNSAYQSGAKGPEVKLLPVPVRAEVAGLGSARVPLRAPVSVQGVTASPKEQAPGSAPQQGSLMEPKLGLELRLEPKPQGLVAAAM